MVLFLKKFESYTWICCFKEVYVEKKKVLLLLVLLGFLPYIGLALYTVLPVAISVRFKSWKKL